MRKLVFVLEDDADISRLIAMHLGASGFQVRTFSTPEHFLENAEEQRPSLFLLDIMVPRGNGLELCRQLGRHPSLSGTPIIFLTARAGEDDRVRGLDAGADDYIVKPFAIRELVARVRAVLRRFDRTEPPAALCFKDFAIDGNAMELKVDGEVIATTATEFRLLEYLARHPGRVFSREVLLDAVWGGARLVTPKSVDVYIRRIREKIEPDPENPRYLRTVRGAGYRFESPRQELQGTLP